MAFLENKELIDSKVIESIGEELKEEFKNESEPNGVQSGGANKTSKGNTFSHTGISKDDLQELVQDLNEILESALEQKIAYTKFIDTLIAKRRMLRDVLKNS